MLRPARAIAVLVTTVLTAAAAALPSVSAATVRPAASTVPTTISSLTLSAGATSLSGAQLTVLTVRLHLVDPDGVAPRTADLADRGWSCPCIMLRSTTSAGAAFRASPQAQGSRLVSLALESGTPQDGVWRGTTILGAGDAGIWRPVSLAAGDFWDETDASYPNSFVPVPADVASTTSFNLRGYDWPLLSIRIPTAVTPVGQRFVVTGSVMTSRSHRPVAGLRVVLGAGLLCSPLDRCVGTAVRTSTTGALALASSDFHKYWSALWAQDANGFPVGYVQAVRMHVRSTVTIGSIATSVRAGGALSVSGHVSPWVDDLGAARLVLQRYYGGSWHSVGTTTAYPGGYRLTAYPPRGSWLYRVRVLTGYDCFGTYSRTVTLRGV